MNVKEAVNVARAYVAELFSSEHAVNMGLEEVEFDDTRGVWNVTIGFSRPWDRPETSPLISVLQPPSPAHRTYKVVRIKDETGHVLAVKNRDTKP